MQIHKTKGIILRTVKYGETSIITTAYTELFGVQSYIVKGVRQSTKKSQGKSNYFQPGAILQMEVYHNELKNLQFVKDFQWACVYQKIFFDVTHNAVATYMIELLQHCLKEPESHPELFDFIEEALLLTDKSNHVFIANMPLYFTLQLASRLGFQIQNDTIAKAEVLDLHEGVFLNEMPLHPNYVAGDIAGIISKLLLSKNFEEASKLEMNRTMRQEVMQALQLFLQLHINNYGEMRSVGVLQELFA